jgi:hypothetical protein
VLAVFAPPTHGPAPVEGFEVTKPPWPVLWLYPIENWVGVSGILWATLVVFAGLLIVPFVDRGEERHPLRRLQVVNRPWSRKRTGAHGPRSAFATRRSDQDPTARGPTGPGPRCAVRGARCAVRKHGRRRWTK